MKANCEKIISHYVNNLARGFHFESSGNDCRIITPFHRPDGEAIEIVVSAKEDGTIRLSDDYITLDYLFINGMHVEKNTAHMKRLSDIARINDVNFEFSEIFTIARNMDHVGESMDRLINAVNASTFLIYKRTSRTRKTFKDEVYEYLHQNDIAFKSDHVIKGATIPHTAPIFVNTGKKLVISAFSTDTLSEAKKNVQVFAFMASDVRKINEQVGFAALLDDRKDKLKRVWQDRGVRPVLEEYIDYPITWDGRRRLIEVIHKR